MAKAAACNSTPQNDSPLELTRSVTELQPQAQEAAEIVNRLVDGLDNLLSDCRRAAKGGSAR
jgi:hypothetical protein